MGHNTDRRPEATRLPTGRRAALGLLFHPAQLRSAGARAQQVSWRNALLVPGQASLATLIALPLLHLSPWPELVGFGSLGTLVALFARFMPAGQRMWRLGVASLLQLLAVLLIGGAAALGAAIGLQLVLLALFCGFAQFVATRVRLGAPGPLIFAFAAGASVREPALTSGSDLLAHLLALGVVCLLALAICALSEPWRAVPSPERPLPVEPLMPVEDAMRLALRSAVGAGAALALAQVFGAAHPAWAAMGAMAVIQGAHLHLTLSRALQRMVGTLLGVVLAGLILTQQPGLAMLVVLIVAMQFATEAVIAINYAYGQIFVTPMALVMTWIGEGGHMGQRDDALDAALAMLGERIVDTGLGALVGVAVALILSSLSERRALARQLGRLRARD